MRQPCPAFGVDFKPRLSEQDMVAEGLLDAIYMLWAEHSHEQPASDGWNDPDRPDDQDETGSPDALRLNSRLLVVDLRHTRRW